MARPAALLWTLDLCALLDIWFESAETAITITSGTYVLQWSDIGRELIFTNPDETIIVIPTQTPDGDIPAVGWPLGCVIRITRQGGALLDNGAAVTPSDGIQDLTAGHYVDLTNTGPAAWDAVPE